MGMYPYLQEVDSYSDTARSIARKVFRATCYPLLPFPFGDSTTPIGVGSSDSQLEVDPCSPYPSDRREVAMSKREKKALILAMAPILDDLTSKRTAASMVKYPE